MKAICWLYDVHNDPLERACFGKIRQSEQRVFGKIRQIGQRIFGKIRQSEQ